MYIPIWDYEDDEVTEFYEIIGDILKEDGRGEKDTIIMVKINNDVGDKSYRNFVGPYGLGRRSQRGKTVDDFCVIIGLVVTNTWSEKSKRKFYT